MPWGDWDQPAFRLLGTLADVLTKRRVRLGGRRGNILVGRCTHDTILAQA